MTRPMRNGFHDTTATDWRAERARPVVEPKLPVIEAPIQPARMSAGDRMKLEALVEHFHMTYTSFARKSKAFDDLVVWIDEYKAGK